MQPFGHNTPTSQTGQDMTGETYVQTGEPNLPNFLRRRTTVDGTARRINLILVTHSLTQAVTNWQSTIVSRDTKPWILGRVECRKQRASAHIEERFDPYTVLWAFHTIQPCSWKFVWCISITQTTLHWRRPRLLQCVGCYTSSPAIAERPRDARVTSIRKIAKWNYWATL